MDVPDYMDFTNPRIENNLDHDIPAEDYSWECTPSYHPSCWPPVKCVICHKADCPTPITVMHEAHMIIGDREAILDEWIAND